MAAVLRAQFFSPFIKFIDLVLLVFDTGEVGVIVLSKLLYLRVQCPYLGTAVTAVFIITQYLIVQFTNFLFTFLLSEFCFSLIFIKLCHFVTEFLVIVILHFQFLVENLHLHFFFKHAILQLVLFGIRLGNFIIQSIIFLLQQR